MKAVADKNSTQVFKRLTMLVKNFTNESLKTYEIGQRLQSPIFEIALGDNISKW